MLAAFFHGWFLCLGVILPLGVQNVFIFNQGAQHRRWLKALPAVITAAVCDSLLILLAVGGVSVLVFSTPVVRYALTIAGILFLIYMGVVIWRSRPRIENDGGETWGLKRQIAFAASVSLLNPHAIIDTVAVVGPSSLVYHGLPLKAYAAGCLFNSWLWFLALMTVGHLIGRLPRAVLFLTILNRISAVIMWACSLLLLKSLIAG